MRKGLIALSGLGLISAAIAGGPDLVQVTPPCSFDGFYFGLGVGGELGQNDIDANVVDLTDPDATPLAFTNATNSSSIVGSAFLGFGKTFQNRYYLGLEAVGDLSSLKRTVNFAIEQVRVRPSNWDVGFDLRPGVLVTPCTLMYARAGVGIRQIKSNFNVFASSPSSNQASLINVLNTNKTEAGFRLGLGFEQMVTHNVSLGMDYVFTQYGKASSTIVVPDPAASGDNMFSKFHRKTPHSFFDGAGFLLFR